MDIVDLAAKFVAKVLVNMMKEGYIQPSSFSNATEPVAEEKVSENGYKTIEIPEEEVPYANRSSSFNDLCKAAQGNHSSTHGSVGRPDGSKGDVVKPPLCYKGFYVINLLSSEGTAEYIVASPAMATLATFDNIEAAKVDIDARIYENE